MSENLLITVTEIMLIRLHQFLILNPINIKELVEFINILMIQHRFDLKFGCHLIIVQLFLEYTPTHCIHTIVVYFYNKYYI